MARKTSLFLLFALLVSSRSSVSGAGLFGGMLGNAIAKVGAVSGEMTLPRAEGRYKCSTLWDFGYSGPDSVDPGRYDNDDPYDKATSVWDTASQVSAVGFAAFWGTLLDDDSRSSACKTMGLGYRTPQPCFPPVKGGGSRIHGCVLSPGSPGGVTYTPGTPGTTTYNPGTPGTTTYNPGTPGTTTYNPGTSGTTTYNPGTSGTTTYNPGTPSTTTYRPPSTSYNPGTSGTATYNPGTPGTTTYNPGTPGTTTYNPGTPGTTQYNPGTPGTIQYTPGQPGVCPCACNG